MGLFTAARWWFTPSLAQFTLRLLSVCTRRAGPKATAQTGRKRAESGSGRQKGAENSCQPGGGAPGQHSRPPRCTPAGLSLQRETQAFGCCWKHWKHHSAALHKEITSWGRFIDHPAEQTQRKLRKGFKMPTGRCLLPNIFVSNWKIHLNNLLFEKRKSSIGWGNRLQTKIPPHLVHCFAFFLIEREFGAFTAKHFWAFTTCFQAFSCTQEDTSLVV